MAAAVLVLEFVPPLWTESVRYEYVQALQFCLAAYALPALIVIGRPWGRLGGDRRRGRTWRWLERLGDGRLRHASFTRAFAYVALDAVLVILWRTPAWTDAVVQHRWLVVAEVVSLGVAGIGLWLELIACPPLRPRLHRPWRAVMAAIAMWASWVMAFSIGFANASWYHVFDHTRTGLSVLLDQEIGTGILWLAAVCTFLPVIFADVMTWLRNDEDPDAELRKMVRQARRSGRA
jgi:cytochrome c oxidase assembly factor CtaG